ncbi:MAG: hypothetical protein KJO62_02770, partial [Gammaproteobacteria bacterium]|nr:hypothetical protein [Gammaproteobacteria bacterium]
LAARLLCQQLNTSIEPAQPCGECRGCELFQAATHPDYYRLAVAADRKTIGVDDVRALLQSLQLAAQIGGARVAVIGPAESLTENAANALLKALEEPGSDTYFMLLSQTARAVLPTIASRSQRIVLGLPSQASLATWLARSVEGSSKAAVANAVQRARVYPELALELLGDDSLHSEHAAIADALLGGELSSHALAEKIDQSSLGAFLDTLMLRLLGMLREQLSGIEKGGNPAMTSQTLQTLLDTVLEAKRSLSRSPNTRLCAAELGDRLASIRAEAQYSATH